jgi:hypothetical protein
MVAIANSLHCVKSPEIFKRQDDAITAAKMILDLIPDDQRMHWFMVSEFAGVNKWLDKIEAPRGDDKSQRELLVAASVELMRRAVAIRPVRVQVLDRK